MKISTQHTLKLLLTAGVLSLTLPACDKQLEEYNPSGLTAEAVYSTPAGFETLVNAAYSYNRWWYGKENGYSISEMGTDLWQRGAGDVNPDLTEYTTLQGSSAALTDLWNRLYAGVNVCNAGIGRVGQSGMTDALKKTREGELRFLRAFYYWEIVETWGGVHFTTEEATAVQNTANKTPVETFYKQIFEDLTVAVANLPTTTTDYGRVTKPAAEAFLAKMYLTRGQNREAADLAQKVISSYGYALQPKFADLWSMSNLENKEILWAVNYSKDLSLNDRVDATLYPDGHPRGGNNGHLLFLMKYDDQPGVIRDIPYGRPFNRFMPSLFYLNLFNEKIDSRYAATFQTVWLANRAVTGIAVGDTAIIASKYIIPASVKAQKKYRIWDQSAVYRPNGTISGDRIHYVTMKKFMDPTRPTIAEEQSARDAYVIRLADVYLTAAEAEFKAGNSTKAADLINVVRRRAALPGKEADMLIKPADVTLDFILDERGRELGGEQLRWFDLKRTGKLVERVKKYNPDAGASIQDYHLVRPIPQRQLDAVSNKNEFTQNPGYR
ncbi:RagB/SusD family nutrient uptake outer membrane protein [Hymenobacter taeanensis]|uniref:RagB/SusD family nutrient uptake outer membrane protein n=1 Tax=Hymenobacter taeanensis TaxID=2735321 RepID=A0A6M6BIX9_9BACT|nr:MULTISPECIES: RagB/SusD family nutrient uptake outer membrane protein [Hymenobacter]QJX47990.1 RagB/SusD family nutrient uptake outer membrane protein [Hymenobacter taeanensis]UOQ82561.1 RagB/SusD family nutrient uptake outer membrane protein [Hymenobacter sp. 5414T-23]